MVKLVTTYDYRVFTSAATGVFLVNAKSDTAAIFSKAVPRWESQLRTTQVAGGGIPETPLYVSDIHCEQVARTFLQWLTRRPKRWSVTVNYNTPS